jgi:hypothetical protein
MEYVPASTSEQQVKRLAVQERNQMRGRNAGDRGGSQGKEEK